VIHEGEKMARRVTDFLGQEGEEPSAFIFLKGPLRIQAQASEKFARKD